MKLAIILIGLIATACTNVVESAVIKEESSILGKDEVESFFSIESSETSLDSTLLFYTEYSDNPIRWMVLDSNSLSSSRVISVMSYDFLFLKNVSENTYSFFYKKKGEETKSFVESKGVPDSVSILEMNDTLIAIEYLWYKLENRRTYQVFSKDDMILKKGFTIWSEEKIAQSPQILINQAGEDSTLEVVWDRDKVVFFDPIVIGYNRVELDKW